MKLKKYKKIWKILDCNNAPCFKFGVRCECGNYFDDIDKFTNHLKKCKEVLG